MLYSIKYYSLYDSDKTGNKITFDRNTGIRKQVVGNARQPLCHYQLLLFRYDGEINFLIYASKMFESQEKGCTENVSINSAYQILNFGESYT